MFGWRKSLISIGLFFWSAMTALSGLARGFASLATFRIGVGVGESSASPAAFSMLGDYFPPRMRATAVAIYSSGVYIGSGIGMLIGGQVVGRWNNAFPNGEGAPFGLMGWQAAFFVVGLPGLLMAIWVALLKEPVRGQSEGLPEPPPHPNPFGVFFEELASVVPPFTLLSLSRSGGGSKVLLGNLAIAAGCVAFAWGMIAWLNLSGWGTAQWIALAFGLYAFFSWLQAVAIRDKPAFSMIYKSRTMVFGMIGFAWCAFVAYAIGFWGAPFFQRVHNVGVQEAGTVLGLIAAVGGLLGVAGGGYFSDWLRRRTSKARLICGMITAIASLPIAYLMLTTNDLQAAYALNFCFQFFSSFWIGSAVALANELVMPRMRATASAYYILVVTFIGLALGPYTLGQMSARLAPAGADAVAAGEALRTAMIYGLVAYVPALVFLFIASLSVEKEESGRLDRARAAGEPVEA